jgi:hypothetical protein
MVWNVLRESCCGAHLTTGSRIGKEEDLMAATRAKRKSNRENTREPEGFLASAARTVGHAAGAAAKAIGLDHADSGRTKTPKRLSARVRRTNHAEEVKAAAKSLFPKGSAALGAPYRRVMGKPTANWTEKDLEYINGLVAKHGK